MSNKSNLDKYFLAIIIISTGLIGIWFSYQLFIVALEAKNSYLETLSNIHPIIPLIPGFITQTFAYVFILVFLLKIFSTKKNKAYSEKETAKEFKPDIKPHVDHQKTVVSKKGLFVYLIIFFTGVILAIIYILYS